MLLVIDIGNTNIVLGLYEKDTLLDSWRIQTNRRRTSDEYGIWLRSLFVHHEIESKMIHDVIISSVVPPLTTVIESMCRRYFKRKPLLVGPGLKTGMPILYDNPKEVGADRIVNAVAAYSRFKSAGIVVDFGTATTFDAIGPQGEYLGGAIAPGIGISAEALFQRASKLPRVEIVEPPSTIGRNTVQSMQAGLFFGYVGLTDGIVTQMKEEILAESYGSGDVFVLATGGLAPLFAAKSTTIEAVEENLTLEGLLLLYKRNRR